ncbi:MAG TPA: N-acetylmuramoyl-L-alanine amidase [Candidatus Eisenbacteria bacterium]
MRSEGRLKLGPAAAAAALLLAAAAGAATADPVTLTGARSWSAPANTRVVFDFSSDVTPVAPDSGVTHELAVSVPGVAVVRADSVPALVKVGDGVVDSVAIEAGPTGALFRLWFHDTTSFRVFTLPPEEGQPFRIVVDVARPGAAAAESQRLARIAAEKRRDRVRIVAVDAGHGGEDMGARGPGGVLEKHVTLGVARALAQELGRVPGVRTVLTRDGDYFIPLRDRYRLAEKVKADLFISIHANSSRRRGRGSGSEVYFLSQRGASDQADADLANLENAADLVGGVPPEAEDDLVNILYDVKRSSAMQQSQLLAEALLEHVSADRRLESRGVKQAGFMVLKSVEFPSVLFEVAFINNPLEARLLRDPAFQRQMARQLAEGVKTYLQRAGLGRPEGAPGDGGQ